MRALRFALLIALAACSSEPLKPVYTTQMHLVPPLSEAGSMCANNCLSVKQQCKQNCVLQMQLCQNNVQMQEQAAYQQYVVQQQQAGKKIKKNQSDFHAEGNCESQGCEAQCVSNHNICFTNCGGQVLPETICVANCQLIAPPTPAAIPTDR